MISPPPPPEAEIGKVVTEDKELEENIKAAGNALFSPPSSLQQLLLLLHKLDICLARVGQDPSTSMLLAMDPARKALTTKQLVNHSDIDVKVFVASCISEILRIAAPDVPYSDETTKEILKLIVAAFADISETSSRSYIKRVSILEITAHIAIYIEMINLRCDFLILKMFKHFFSNIRENHPNNVFFAMGRIMIMTIEEIDEITPGLLFLLLDSVRNANKNVLPIARKLGERVIENCIVKLAPYIYQAVEYMGFPRDNFGVDLHFCETLGRNRDFASQDNPLAIFLEKLANHPSTDAPRKLGGGNSTVQIKEAAESKAKDGEYITRNGHHAAKSVGDANSINCVGSNDLTYQRSSKSKHSAVSTARKMNDDRLKNRAKNNRVVMEKGENQKEGTHILPLELSRCENMVHRMWKIARMPRTTKPRRRAGEKAWGFSVM